MLPFDLKMPFDLTMKMHFENLGFYLVVILALTVHLAMSQGKSFDPSIPQPMVTYSNPKSSLLQLAWVLHGHGSESVNHFEVMAKDPSSRVFTCDNENYNDGVCTMSGLSADTTYNVTVRGCSLQGCGTPAILSVRTVPRGRIYFGTIFTVFVVLIVLAFAAINYDVLVELMKPCYKALKLRLSQRHCRFDPGSARDVDPVLRDSMRNGGAVQLSNLTFESTNDYTDEGTAGPSAPSESSINTDQSSERESEFTDCPL